MPKPKRRNTKIHLTYHSGVLLMLTPQYYLDCTDELIVLYAKLNDRITRDIARRIVKAGYLTEGAKQQVLIEKEAGRLYDDIISDIAKYTKTSETTVKSIFEDAGITSKNFDDDIFKAAGKNPTPLTSSPAMMQILAGGIKKTNGLVENLTKTTALTSQNAFINACTIAEMEISTGAFDYNTAIKHAVDDAISDGAMVEYASGARMSLEAAIRRAVMTGVSQTTGEISLANAKELGTNLMEITAHGGARPEHAAWQGKIVCIEGRKRGYLTLKDIGYGEATGFKGVNCRHDWYPFVEGISTRAYTDKQLTEYQDKTVTVNGKEMPQYQAEQKQRAMERQIREDRRLLAGYDEAIQNADNDELRESLKSEFDTISVKLKNHEAKYKAFSKETGLATQTARLQTKGFGKSVSQKAVHSAKRTIAVQTQNAQYKEYLSNVKNGVVELKEHQQTLLDKLPSAGSFIRVKKKDVSLDDLAALSAKAKCEFALFNKGKNSIVLRGNYRSCNIGKTLSEEVIDNKWEWVGHSHPTITQLTPSNADVSALKIFTWQKKSSIIDLKGRVITFTANEQDWFNSILGVK